MMMLTCARSATQALQAWSPFSQEYVKQAPSSEHTSAQIREEIIRFLLYDSFPMLAACAFLNILQPPTFMNPGIKTLVPSTAPHTFSCRS